MNLIDPETFETNIPSSSFENEIPNAERHVAEPPFCERTPESIIFSEAIENAAPNGTDCDDVVMLSFGDVQKLPIPFILVKDEFNDPQLDSSSAAKPPLLEMAPEPNDIFDDIANDAPNGTDLEDVVILNLYEVAKMPIPFVLVKDERSGNDSIRAETDVKASFGEANTPGNFEKTSRSKRHFNYNIVIHVSCTYRKHT